MENIIKGKVFVAGDNIDTDQIIPAEYLSYNPSDEAERKFFGKFAMSGVPIAESGLPKGNIPFVKDGFTSEFALIIGGRNFGCGSSREHAPLAIAESGCKAVVAESYARIFYRNSINGGYIWPMETSQRLVDLFATGDDVELNLTTGVLKNLDKKTEYKINPLGDVAQIVNSGGIFPHARKTGMLKK